MDSVVGCDAVVSGVFGCYSNCVWVDDVDVDGVGEYGVELRCSIFHLVLVVQDSRSRAGEFNNWFLLWETQPPF